MKKAIKAASFLVAITSAMSASAAPPDMQGSDTLEEITKDLIKTNCGHATNAFIAGDPASPVPETLLNYVGGGSGTAANAMVAQLSATAGARQLAGPMSRAFTTVATTGECARAETAAPGSAATAVGLVIGLDGVVIVGSSSDTGTCGAVPHSAGTGTPGVAGSYKQSGPNFTVMATDGDTIAGSGPDPDGVRSVYTFGGTTAVGWKDVLRLLYTGLDHTQVNPALPLTSAALITNCTNPARVALAASYNSLFKGGCTSSGCTLIKHAYRRGDVSGTTDSFLSLIGAPAVTRSTTGAVTGTPFCNGFETEDKDPVRRTCSQDEQVCEADGTLGLVLPIVVPTFSNDLTLVYNADAIRSVGNPANDVSQIGKFKVVTGTSCLNPPDATPDATGSLPAITTTGAATELGFNLPAGWKFPNTARCDCRFPTPESYASLNTGAGTTARAVNLAFAWNRRSGGCWTSTNPELRLGLQNGDSASGADNSPGYWGTRYNNTPEESGKSRCCAQGATKYKMDPRSMNLLLRNPSTGAVVAGTGPAFYKIHANNKGRSVLPNNAGTYVNGVTVCQDQDATRLIACLSQVPMTCSVGFAGREAAESVLASAVNAEPFAINQVNPIVSNIQNLISAAGPVYPLSRKLFYNSFVGFNSGGLIDPNGAASAAVNAYEAANYNLYKCFADVTPRGPTGTVVAESIQALARAGFVRMPVTVANPTGAPMLCPNMCTTNNACATANLTAVPAADLAPAFTP